MLDLTTNKQQTEMKIIAVKINHFKKEKKIKKERIDYVKIYIETYINNFKESI